MNRSTELKLFLSKLKHTTENEIYLRKVFELPSYVFIIVCNALMDRKITLKIMDEFLYDVECEVITEKNEVNYDEFIKRLQLDYNPGEEFPSLKEDKAQMVLACIIKKCFDNDKYINIDDYVKELKDISEELDREYKIHSKFEDMNIDNLIRNLNLETRLSTNKLQFYRNKLMMKAKEIRNLEAIRNNTTEENSLRAINTRLNRIKREFSDLYDTVNSIERNS